MDVDRRAFLVGGAGLAGGLLLASGAMSAPLLTGSVSKPVIYSRRKWDAKPPRRPGKILNRRPEHIVIHHTATANSKDYSLEHAFELSRQVQKFHMARRGWNDIGQHFTISRGGHIMEGRHRTLRALARGDHVMGAQAANHNAHSLGIENEGSYTRVTPPARQLESLVHLCAYLCWRYELDPMEAIVGHRDFTATTCPGHAFYRMLDQLRRAVVERIEGQPLLHPLSPSPSPRRSSSPEPKKKARSRRTRSMSATPSVTDVI